MRKNFYANAFQWPLFFLFSFLVFLSNISNAQLIERWVANSSQSFGANPGTKNAVLIGPDGNIVVSGSHAIIKYNPAGTQIWIAQPSFPTGYLPRSIAMAMDNGGNIYITTINASGNSSFAGDLDIYIAKYSPAGTQLWERWYDGPTGQNDVATGIAVDQSGNVYITGITNIDLTHRRIHTLKYNATGTFQWGVTYNESSRSGANAIAVDYYTGDVYVGGYSEVPGTGKDFTTIGYNTNGVQQWANTYDGSSPYDSYGSEAAYAAIVDSDGNPIFTGTVTGTYESSCCGDQDVELYATFKYDRVTGAIIWKKGYGDNQSEGDGYFLSIGRAIALDTDDNVIVTGSSELSSDGSREWATIKYRKSDGAAQWVRRYNNAAYVQEDIFDDDNDVAHAVTVDGDGNAYVTGYSKANDSKYDIVTIKYNATNGSDAGFARYDYGSFDKPADIAVDPFGNVYVTGSANNLTTIKYGLCTIICPDNITANNTTGQCGAIVNYSAATTSGNCGTLEYNQASGTFFPVGVTTVTVTSASSGESCSFTVTINDAEFPTITCPAPVTVSCSALVPSVNTASVSASDNCPGVTVTHVSDVISNQTCANRFILTRTYQAKDASGNKVSCSQVITVYDNIPPVISNISVTPASLWPPNHTMRDITVNYQLSDNCVNSPATALSVSSNEPINGTGDGDTAPDWTITDNHHVKLRAERSGNGSGRIYTITISSNDGCNATATAITKVTVPKNNSQNKTAPPETITNISINKDFLVAAFPNPAASKFYVNISGSNTKEKIMLQVYNVNGRLIETRHNVNEGSTVQLGNAYRPGVYLLRVMQGKNHKELKLVKLSD